jgi:cytochrome P450
MEQYRQQHVRPIVSYTIDRLAGRGRADLASDFADQIPPRVLMSLFGMPWQDDALVERVLKLHDDVLIWIGGQNKNPDATRIARAARKSTESFLRPTAQGDPQRSQARFDRGCGVGA